MNIKIGLNNKAEKFSGLEIALINETTESRGVNVAGLVNVADDSSYGVNVAGESKGVNVGLINYVLEKCYGCQLGVINANNWMRGAQFGLYNVCGKDSKGVQIGLLNHRKKAPWYSRFIPLIAVRNPASDEKSKK